MLNMKEKKHKRLLYVLSYLYIFFGFSYIINYISYHIRITNKPLGWVVLLFDTLVYFAVYIAINHILIRKVISSKLLLMIEALLFVAMLTLVISDLEYEIYLNYRYS